MSGHKKGRSGTKAKRPSKKKSPRKYYVGGYQA